MCLFLLKMWMRCGRAKRPATGGLLTLLSLSFTTFEANVSVVQLLKKNCRFRAYLNWRPSSVRLSFYSSSFFLFLSFFRWTRQRNYKWKENNFWNCFVFRLFCSLLFFFLSLSCVSFYFFYSGRRNFFKPATLESNRKYTSLTIKTSHTIKTSLTIKTSDTIKTLHRASGVGGGISISIPPGRSVGPRRTNLFD